VTFVAKATVRTQPPQSTMALTATPARRRLIMIALLLLAVAGSLIRYFAPDPSTLRDIGTLLMVLWLPAVGNLVAYFVRKIPRKPTKPAGFAEGSAFTPHLRVRLEPTGLVADLPAAFACEGNQCTLIVGNAGFTARIGPAVPGTGAEDVPVELLRPEVALPALKPGTQLRLVIGAIAAARGQVVELPQG
jgi:hypothetical protein